MELASAFFANMTIVLRQRPTRSEQKRTRSYAPIIDEFIHQQTRADADRDLVYMDSVRGRTRPPPPKSRMRMKMMRRVVVSMCNSSGASAAFCFARSDTPHA